MKKTFLLAATALALNAAVNAAPLDPKGIPADAQGIVHIDLDLCAKSTAGAALKQYAEKTILADTDKRDQYDAFKTETGIDPLNDLNGLTIGILKDEAAGNKTPAAVLVARGKFATDRLLATARKNNGTITKLGAMTMIEGKNIFGSLNAGEKSAHQKQCVVIADKNTLLFAETADLVKKAADAFAGETQNYATPATLDIFSKQGGAPLLLVYASRALTNAAGQQMPISKAENALVSISETGSNLHARVYTDYATPEAARKTQATVQMLLGFMQMGAANSESPEAAEQMQSLQRLVDSLKMNINGKSLDITADYPVADLVQLLKKQSAEQ